MKRKLILGLGMLLAVSLSMQAQNMKIGYADVDYILSQLPEMKQVQSELQSQNTQLQNQLDAKLKEYQNKLQIYQETANTMLPAVKQDKERELAQLEQNIQKFQTDASNSVQKKQADLMQPLYEKVGNVIETVAKEKGYDFILNGQIAGVDVVIYADKENDISNAVLQKMGVTPSN